MGSAKKHLWECELGHQWQEAPKKRTNRGDGCPYCSGRRVLIGFNDLVTTHPELAKELLNSDPLTISMGSAKKHLWECELGHRWHESAKKRAIRGDGCPYCSGRRVLIGFNDLVSTHPELAKELVNSDPLTISLGSGKKHLWQCKFGHRWKADVKHRTQGRGCPSCAQSGFDPNKDAWIYFLEHPDWEMLQIGITNFPDDRLATHIHLGWNVLELHGAIDGHIARQWETDILRVLRKKHAVVGSTEIAGKFTGYTESWMKSSFPISSLKELMQLVRTDQDTR
jgi:DNA-directed RNA polymerase subunit RPC12/RpoP